jgi:eukaryotic-like serine/threonine-protein kinase
LFQPIAWIGVQGRGMRHAQRPVVNTENMATRMGGWGLPRPALTLDVGTVLHGSYRILRPLATGGRGQLFVASHTRLPGKLAVKALHPSLTADAAAMARFRREAEITASLRHPHIVQLFDYNTTEHGVPYLVMELLEGQSLAERVALGKPFEPRATVRIVDQMAHALHAAHTRGIVHRDLKPDNVILQSADGEVDFVKIVDFGISQASWRPRLTAESLLVGTPQYMSPEQARGRRDEIDHRSDQFSLAAIAYALLTGWEPFKGDEPVAVLYQVVHEAPPLVSSIATWLPDAVDAVIVRGLAKDAADRYPDVLAFAAALSEAIDLVREPVGIPAVPEAIPEESSEPITTPITGQFRRHAVDASADGTAQREDGVDEPPTTEIELPTKEPGPTTMQVIRKARARTRNRSSALSALAFLAAASIVGVVSPAARQKALTVSQHARTGVQVAEIAVLSAAGCSAASASAGQVQAANPEAAEPPPPLDPEQEPKSPPQFLGGSSP